MGLLSDGSWLLSWLLAILQVAPAWSGDDAPPSALSTTTEPAAFRKVLTLGGNSFDRFISPGACHGPSLVLFSGLATPQSHASEDQALKAFEACAEEVYGLACLGIIDCSKWPSQCKDQNVRQTPAVVLHPLGSRPARFFRGLLTQEAFTAAVARLISFGDRTVHLSMGTVNPFLEHPLLPLKVILFSRRTVAPVIFKALSSDPELWPHMHFGFVPEKESAILAAYAIETVPRVVIQYGNDLSTREFYESTNITYPALREWLMEKKRTVPLGPLKIPPPEEEEAEPEIVDEEEEEEESAPASSGPAYVKLAAGTAGCPEGQAITSVAECKQALKELGVKVEPSWVSNFPGLPSRCSVRDSPSAEHPERMHYNSYEGGAGRSDLSPVCRRKQAASSGAEKSLVETLKSATGGQEVTLTQLDLSELPEQLQQMAQKLGGITISQGGMKGIEDLLNKVTGGGTETAANPPLSPAPAGSTTKTNSPPTGKPSPGSPPPRQEYMKLPLGANACPPGTEITTVDECKKAIESLGMSATPTWTAAYAGVPVLCSVREKPTSSGPYAGKERMHWNTATEGEGRPDLAPVCRKPPGTPGKNRLVTELSGKTQGNLLGEDGWFFVYLKDGPLSDAEEEMILRLKDTFKVKMDEQGIHMTYLWLDLRAERAIKSLLDPPALPSALVMKAGSNPKYVLATHQERDEEPVAADEDTIVLLLNTVLGGDAKFVRVAAKKLAAAWSVKRF
eukprot:TRINITY_DN2541_c0_g2_i2.p1 TRINITY_DN2541_c0_g2~~TRINITY_DN2541_c0_g2_i2.p1  ORF type:complete len:743 (-),score=153.53 TRINITY_DN2541_c0_g2_i2:65-2269(-)